MIAASVYTGQVAGSRAKIVSLFCCCYSSLSKVGGCKVASQSRDVRFGWTGSLSVSEGGAGQARGHEE